MTALRKLADVIGAPANAHKIANILGLTPTMVGAAELQSQLTQQQAKSAELEGFYQDKLKDLRARLEAEEESFRRERLALQEQMQRLMLLGKKL